MHPVFVFGWRTAILSVVIVQLLSLALALGRTSVNRTANRCIAALLVVFAGILTPDAIGFAGFYDAFPWLSFAPFSIPLAVGPLFYLYAFALTHPTLPHRAAWHLSPPLVQFLYQGASFCLPLPLKSRWDEISTPVISPIVTLGVIVGLGTYCVASLRALRRYRVALADLRSDDERFASRWLSRAAIAMLTLLCVWTVYDAYDMVVAPLDYFSAFGLYLIIAGIASFLGIEGWRHADRRFPFVVSLPMTEERAGRDWTTIVAVWSDQVRAGRWYEDPELSLSSLARQLGTNTSYLSRAINEGLGVNFSTFVADMRCDAVALALRSGSETDILTLALDAGFGSKASFNRSFLAKFAESPSSYRRRHVPDQE